MVGFERIDEACLHFEYAWIGGGVIVAGIGLFVFAAVRRKRTQND